MRSIAASLLILFASAAFADRLVLTDGTTLEGRVKKQPDGSWVIVGTDGKSTPVAASKVAKVEVTGSADAAAADKFASLKRSVEPLANIDEIIQRFERFIAVNPNTQSAEDAVAEVALWRDRKARGLVKTGLNWMTPQERFELLRKINPQIAQARELLRSGRQRDAELLIGPVLELDSRHFGALYLNGVILYQQEKYPAARKAFEAVNAQIADHAPTLNNLAVVSLKQNQVGPALNFFDQAMIAMPADRVIVDNVAEALNALKEDSRRLAIARKVEKRFGEQDTVLSNRLQKEGLFRWGATFVEKKQFDQLVAAEKAIKDKIDQMKSDFDAMSARINVIDRQIQSSERELKRIEADSYFIDTNGNYIRRPLPSFYYDQQRDLQSLAGEKAQVQAQQKAMRQQADRVQQDLPVPKYTGVQKLIGEEGAPVEQEATAATAPSTRPG